MSYGLSLFGTEALEKELARKSELDLINVQKKQMRDIYTRGQEPGGTPVGDYAGGGQLRMSMSYTGDETGYTKDYGPHVEFGHRLRNGGFLPGQYYFKTNVDSQRLIYKEDLKNKLKE
ncbi:hypothetical protein [Enterococcus sp. AZ103]|uniref:hypothetical protein n=1 Tax=Enterococcus sp. AZ103 TaxID=2774628 RepID=UPI003F290880